MTPCLAICVYRTIIGLNQLLLRNSDYQTSGTDAGIRSIDGNYGLRATSFLLPVLTNCYDFFHELKSNMKNLLYFIYIFILFIYLFIYVLIFLVLEILENSESSGKSPTKKLQTSPIFHNRFQPLLSLPGDSTISCVAPLIRRCKCSVTWLGSGINDTSRKRQNWHGSCSSQHVNNL